MTKSQNPLMRRLLSTLRRSEDGQAIAELALVLPVLLLVLVGIVEIGHAVNAWNNDTNAANVAARYAVVGNLPTTGACPNKTTFEAFIVCEAELAGVPKPITSCVSIEKAAVGEPVEVKVYSKYKWISYLKLPQTEAAITGTATMRLEQVPNSSLGYQSSKCP
jgi:hypothetical protein